MLQRIVYVSRAVYALKDSELNDILATARPFNRQAGITGVLFYKNGSFLQVLEGDSERLHALLSRIKRDRRHTRMRIVSTLPIAEREFADWEMGFANLDGWQGKQPTEYQAYFASEFDFSDVIEPAARLMEFARRFPDFAVPC